MNHGVRTVVYPVKDLARSKKLFRNLLGVEPYADQPYYVGIKIGEQDIGLVPKSSVQGQAGMTVFYHVDNIKQSLQSLLDAGVRIQEDIKDVGKGTLIAIVTDSDGNTIGLRQSP